MEAAGPLSALKCPWEWLRGRLRSSCPLARGSGWRSSWGGSWGGLNGGCSIPGHSDPMAFTSRVPSQGSTFTSALCSHAPGTSPWR